MILNQEAINQVLLLSQWQSRCLLLFIIDLLLFAFLANSLFLFLLFTSVSLYLLLELHINGDTVVLSKVTWNWDLDDRWVVLKVKEKLVQVNVD